MGDSESFDSYYEQADTFAEVYDTIVERLVSEAEHHHEILYAVPGSPLVLERTVQLLLDLDHVEVVVHPAMSFLDVAWARLGIDPVEHAVQLVDGHRFADVVVAPTGPLLVAHCHNQRVLSDIKLALDDVGDEPVVVLQRLGTPDERVSEVAWWDLDREVEADHLTSIFITDPGPTTGAALGRLADLVATLRRECPWDREQTHASLRRHLVEETYEVIESIDALDAAEPGDAHAIETADQALLEELGDLLFQPLLHAVIAAEEGRFSAADVADGIHDKLVQRHPHVFEPGADEVTTDHLLVSWEAAKRVEKHRESVFDGIAPGLPALAMAAKVLRKAATLGIDTDVAADDLVAAVQRVDHADGDTFGRLILAVVAAANRVGIDAEDALRQTAGGLRNRLRQAEIAGDHLESRSAFDG